jgi:hypothetical protein
MQQSERSQTLLRLVHFGFDRDHLYVRLDTASRIVDLLAAGWDFSLKFLPPHGAQLSIHYRDGHLTHAWNDGGQERATIAAGTVLEVGLPFRALGAAIGAPVSFFVTIADPTGAQVERHPSQRPIEIVVPDEGFEARNWSA